MKTYRNALRFGACLGLTMAASLPAVAGESKFQYLPADSVQMQNLLPAPAADGSVSEKVELGEIRALIAASSPQRLAQATWDNNHEDPSLFDATLNIKLEQFPKTWALLKATQAESDTAASAGKVYFHRKRPWAIDTTLPRCDSGSTAKPERAYPSGHAALSYSTGYVLARLLPSQAEKILGRSQDYAQSRVICGVHYPSDTEASHVLGTVVAIDLLANPKFVQQFEAARAELKAAHVNGT